MTTERPKFITIEGIEGAGKSTAMHVIEKLLQQKGVDFLLTREPGGTDIAEDIRQIFLKKHAEVMTPETELLLLFAARAQHLNQVVLPHLAQGKWVICDRFTDASYAYQGGGRGVDISYIEALETWIQGEFRPDAVLLLDAPVSVCLERTKQRGHLDRIELEQHQFFERVRAAYLQRAKRDPARYYLVDAAQKRTLVAKQIMAILSRLF